MTPEGTQTEGVALIIAMLELMFLTSRYYRRLLMMHCIVQPT